MSATPPTILVADDDRSIRTVLTQALGRSGYQVRSTGTASMLWRWVEEGEGDLVITDVMMPVGTGIDLLRAARSAGHTVPMLFVSGYAMESLEGILESDPRTGMLTKPWNMADLERVVRETASR